MNSKVKLIIAVVFFVIAIAAIAYYFVSSNAGGPSPVEETMQNATDADAQQPPFEE